MRYNTELLPIRLITSRALSKQEQIKAISYIRNNLIEDDKFKTYIANEDSRQIIRHYLGKLESQIIERID